MLSTLPPATVASFDKAATPIDRRSLRRIVASLLIGTALLLPIPTVAEAGHQATQKASSQKSGGKKQQGSQNAEIGNAKSQTAAAGQESGVSAAGRPVLQFGLYQKEGDAKIAWANFRRRQPDLARNLTLTIAPLGAKLSDGVALRAVVTGNADASALCRRIVDARFGCLVFDPGTPVQTAEATKPAEVAAAESKAGQSKPAEGRPQDARPTASVAFPPAPAAQAPAVQAPPAAPTTPEAAAMARAAYALAKVTASPLPPAPPPAAAPVSPAAAPAMAPMPPHPLAPAAQPGAVQTTQLPPTTGPTVTTLQTAAALSLPLAVPRPPSVPEAAPPPDGTVNYTEEDARTMADIEQSSRSRGRLRAVVPDTRVDVMPATLRRESWNLCALTFDDGPHRTVTRQVLEVLNREGIKATYFPVARVAQNQGDLIRDFLAAGHEIGNHSLTHSDLRAMNAEGQRYEIAEANRILRSFGANPVLFRPPYGRYNSDMLSIARDEQMNPVLWTVDTRDWKVRNADKIVQQIKSGANTGNVFLMHSTYSSTVEALPRVIAELRAKGCEFVTLSEWLERMRLLAAPKIVNAGMPVGPDQTPKATVQAATARN